MLPALDIARQSMVDRGSCAAAGSLRAQVLKQRGVAAGWSWRKAHAVESADFRDGPGGERAAWTPGPNGRSAGNVMERRGDEEEWLWLSSGTDWQAFQGGLRVVSDVGIRPAWVTFQVRVATPELSGANLAFSSHEKRWGLQRPTLLFSYRGDDSTQQRCFMLETCAIDGRFKSHRCHLLGDMSPDEVYKIAIRLDWAKGSLQVFINGRAHVQAAAFETAEPIRLAALYNWRSSAVTGFSELMLGSTCPYALEDPAEAHRSRRRLCPGRHRPSRQEPRPRVRSLATSLPARAALWALAAMAAAGIASMVMPAEQWN